MLPGESEDWQAGQPCQSCKRALQMSLLCSVKPKRRKEGPVTTDNCQLNGTLTLGRPMSSNGGDKCLANQLAYKNHSSSQHCPHQHMKWQHAQSSTLAFSACACVCVCVCVCVSAPVTCPSATGTVTKVLINTVNIETKIRPRKLEIKHRQRNLCSRTTQKETVINWPIQSWFALRIRLYWYPW